MPDTQNKVIIRSLTVNRNTLQSKVEVLAKIKFDPLSSAELDVLVMIMSYCQNNELFISADIAKIIKDKINLTDSAFSMALFRLKKKGIVKRLGRTVMVNPIFAGVHDMDQLLISFSG